MKSNRIFIENLPETATESNIRKQFAKFGEVTSVEIKERKTETLKSWSRFFAYVNLESDEQTLQKCFQFFSQTPWKGQTIKLQIAKESFLERLKRERQLQKPLECPKKLEIGPRDCSSKVSKPKLNGKYVNQKKVVTDSSSSEAEDISVQPKQKFEIDNAADETSTPEDLIIKDNRNKLSVKDLKIESFGKEPVLRIEVPSKQPKNLDKFRTLADHKRVHSLLEKRKAYSTQKSTIKSALSYMNLNKTKRTVFDTEGNNIEAQTDSKIERVNNNKISLFDEDGTDSEEETNKLFEIKEKFQGKAGEKLLKLQSTFKNDSRFTMNEHFLEEEVQRDSNEDDGDIEKEKKKEIEILGEILGCEIKSRITSQAHQSRSDHMPKAMKRFDPSQPDHAKYELKREDRPTTKKRKKDNFLEDKKVNLTEEPEVSTEIFYSVKEDLKKSLEQDSSFSLLNMFGTSEEKVGNAEEHSILPATKRKYAETENPFKYDSSDGEDQTEQLIQATNKPTKTENSIKAWTEPFFFQHDDFRFQEGMDFVKRIATEEKEDFSQIRRNLKEITKNKVRNILRKNKPFKKKLGGNKKKKIRRMNKALNR